MAKLLFSEQMNLKIDVLNFLSKPTKKEKSRHSDQKREEIIYLELSRDNDQRKKHHFFQLPVFFYLNDQTSWLKTLLLPWTNSLLPSMWTFPNGKTGWVCFPGPNNDIVFEN